MHSTDCNEVRFREKNPASRNGKSDASISVEKVCQISIERIAVACERGGSTSGIIISVGECKNFVKFSTI